METFSVATGLWPVRTRRIAPWLQPLFFVVLLIATLLVACNRGTDGRTHVIVWHQKIGGERDLFSQEVSRFNAAHSSIVVEPLYKENDELRNLFIIGAVAGQGPDIIYGPAG